YAQHLFENRRIVEGHGFCYQREPDSIIWAVMDDGALLSCTYLPEQKVVCWSRHDTAGRFESTNCLADANGEDRVYFVVAREINGRIVRFLEVMKEPLVPTDDLAEAFYVDCGLTYRGPETTALLGLEHLEGRDVSVLADGFRRSARVKDGRIELAHPASVVHVGLGYACELDTLDMQPNQQPVKNRSARAIVGAEAHFYKSIECKAGPTGGKAYEVFRSERDGTPTLFSGKKRFNPATPSEPDGYRLHFEMDAPYPLSILAVSALGDVGAS
ncbi:MAG: hypothetical protein LBT97_03880, partial [Planctomycetota bacterium]|nr:hypothetical protein [Planctomycetota bacterium]